MGNSSISTTPNSNVPTILVTGDVVVDHHIYIGEQRSATDINSGSRQTFEHVEFGGAAMIERLLCRPLNSSNAVWNVHFGLEKDQDCFAHCFATWQPFPEPDPSADVTSYWKAREAGYGLRGTNFGEQNQCRGDADARATCQPGKLGCPAKAPEPTDGVRVLVVDDAGAGFRDREESWPKCLDGQSAPPAWMVWKMAGDLRGGGLWGQVKKALPVDSRLILVVSAADLRRAGMDVTAGLSWERGALDVLKELEAPTVPEPLKACAHLIVSFPDAGALWINRCGENDPEAGKEPKTVVRIIYDPSCGVGALTASNQPKAFGYQACLVSGIVWSVASAGDAPRPNLADGLRRGLLARNKLFAEGHGKLDETQSPKGFPAEAIQAVALAPDPDPAHKPKFANTEIPVNAGPNWTIAQQGMMAPGPFYDIAYAVARGGLQALPSIPWLQMGAYVTIERGEIEAMRRITLRVHEYMSRDPQKCPHSIAVFGAPGAGKSFIVKQMAKGFPAKNVQLIECNLSQISDEKDLHGVFHRVRDEILKGNTPVVFWDEFDSQEYRWLRLLLAPMQDGEFREGQVVHPIGKCIFIFAGGTSATFEDFGKNFSQLEDGMDAVEVVRLERAWKMAKGPDFRSRVHGHLDVLGPNQRQVKADGGGLVDDNSDACFPIRRAFFLRGSWKLGRVSKRGNPIKDREFDEGLVRALLEVPKYTDGSRSFERVLSELARGNAPIRPQALPSPEDLHRDIESTDACLQLVKSAYAAEQEGAVEKQVRAEIEARIDEFAARINQVYTKSLIGARNAAVFAAYDNLSLFFRESNRAAVRRLPEILRAANLKVVHAGTPGALKREDALKHLEGRINETAQAEHEAWCDFHRKRGWKLMETPKVRKDIYSDPPRHALLVPWELLTVEADRDLDRDQVRYYVEIVYDLYRHKDDPVPDPKTMFALAPIDGTAP